MQYLNEFYGVSWDYFLFDSNKYFIQINIYTKHAKHRQVSVGLSYNHYILSSLQKQNSNKKSYHNGLQKQKKILSQIKF